MRKAPLIRLIPIGMLAIGAGISFSSCNNTSTSLEQPPQTEYAQPVIQPLTFSKPKKIDWDAIKAVKVNPVVKKLNWDKLPETPYDTAGFKPFKYPVEETKFDYNSLPEKDLDIDKLPSHPLKFKTYILPPPKLIKGAKLVYKNGNLFSLDFGEEQKASGVRVTHLFNDREGFLWIATTQGLYRYDGENLLLFIAGQNRYNFDMLQDARENIWIGNNGGNSEVLDPKSGTLKKLDLGGRFLMQDTKQRIWITSYNNGVVDIIDPKEQTVKKLGKAQGLGLGTKGPWGIIQDKNNNIWISTDGGGINIIDLKNKTIKYLDKTHGLKTDAEGDLICDSKGRIWIGLYGRSINVLDLKKKSIQTIREAQSSPGTYLNLFQDSDGRIWIGTYTNGFEIIDPEKQLVIKLKKSSGLVSDRVECAGQDRNGQVWIGSDLGLNMVSDSKATVERIGKDSVNALMEDYQGLIWKTTPHGVDILDRKERISRHLGVQQGLASDNAERCVEINGRVFIRTDSGLDIVDRSVKTITHLGKKQGLINDPAGAIVIDKKGRTWIAEFGGIDVYDPQNNTIKHLGKTTGLSDTNIDFMCLDKQGRIWVSLVTGAIQIVEPNNGTSLYLNNVRGLKDIADKELLKDYKDNIWIGTDKGVYIADFNKQTLTSITMLQGLIEDKTLSLLQHDGRVFAGNNKGITVITPSWANSNPNKKWELKSYGLSKIYIDNYAGDLITKDGLYWLGDLGINVLDLSKKDTIKSTPYITGISVFDHLVYFADNARINLTTKDTIWELDEQKYYLKGQTPENTGYASQNGLKWDSVSGPGNMPENLLVPYRQNFIQFHYASLNLTPHDSTAYRYLLIGNDKKWSNATTAPSTVNYMNLQPGKYTFEVISRNADNVWSQPAKFSFIINPPWWQTWWAYILYVCLFAGTVWGFVYFRSRQLVKEKRELEQKVHLRTEEVLQQKEEIESQRDNLELQRNDLENTLSKLKTTQTQLIQSEKMASLGELTAGIAHEIQNPLNFVNNFSEVNREMIDELKEELKSGNVDEALAIANDIQQNEEKINHHGKRADGIVKGMLEHSRSGSGQKEATNLNIMADEYMRLSYHGLRAKDKLFNAELITKFDLKLPRINVVQQDLGRVLLNLFNNAFYAVNQKRKTAGDDYKPEVSVTTYTENGHIIIKVTDNGVGIPDAIKEKIMQPFFTTKPTGEGTGLGLSLTYDMVVKGHGGTINVNSTEGEGSEFVISLPS